MGAVIQFIIKTTAGLVAARFLPQLHQIQRMLVSRRKKILAGASNKASVIKRLRSYCRALSGANRR